MKKLFAIRDSRSNLGSNMMFWRDGGGYTSNLNEAERFTLEEAQRTHNNRYSDIPVLLEPLEKAATVAVDCQYLPEKDCHSPSDCYVIQKKGMWNGNDIAFVCDDAGGVTYDYSKAKVFTLNGYASFSPEGEYDDSYQIWSKEAIDKITRKSVAFMHFDKKLMMLDAGIKENKPPKPKRERYKCHGCGKFVTQETYYTYCYGGESCPKCPDF